MNTINALIDRLGGNTAVANLLSKGQTTVSEMKRRRSIPTKYWPKIIAAAHTKGIDLDEATLVRIHLTPAEGVAASNDQATSHAA